MGALKDIVDLTKDLESRAKDRRDMEIIHKIQQLAFSFQSSYADTVERDVRLIQENAELKKKLDELRAEDVRIEEGIEFRKGQRTGGKWKPFCPKCHCPAVTRNGSVYVECSDRECDWLSSVEWNQLEGIRAAL